MPFLVNHSEPLSPTQDYFFKKDHRDNTYVKSQWDISLKDEYDTALLAISNGYFDSIKSFYYNFVVNGSVLQFVGRSYHINKKRIPLKLCKFEQYGNTIHGYPGNHIFSIYDIPAENILKKMITNNLISERQCKKILVGEEI